MGCFRSCCFETSLSRQPAPTYHAIWSQILKTIQNLCFAFAAGAGAKTPAKLIQNGKQSYQGSMLVSEMMNMLLFQTFLNSNLGVARRGGRGIC